LWRGRVVLEAERSRGDVPRPVAARARNGSVGVVWGRVILGSRAGIDPRRRVGAREVDGQGPVVPTVRIRAARRSDGRRRAGRVVLEGESARAADVPGLVEAAA